MSLLTVSALPGAAAAGDAMASCRALEGGAILVLPETPLDFGAGERAVLLGHAQPAASHKNIAYRLDTDRLIGTARRSTVEVEPLRRLLRAYVQQMTALLAALLTPYAARWRIDLTSFRPLEEAARRLPQRARNDLLHIDAFPSRPTNGDRILRVFTNLHPSRPRCWVTTDPFDVLLPRFVDRAAADLLRRRGGRLRHALRRRLQRYAPAACDPVLRRSPYDAFMQRLHDRLKADAEFQRTAPKQRWEFAPGASWIVFTDFVPHAALSGQLALEQTYFLPRAAMLQPERAPASILERLCGSSLCDP